MDITYEMTKNESNSFKSLACNNTGHDTGFEIDVIVNICTILMSFPTNSYVIWLILTGTGNGLAAEFFIFNFSLCEIFYCMECFWDTLIDTHYISESTLGAVYFFDGIPSTGRPLFECLICAERYLAVVHPVTFLKYKPLRYKLMCSAVIWLICSCSCLLNLILWFILVLHLYLKIYLAQFFIFLSIQLFCCLAVLRALKQSGPGERGREREEENNMKRRAFNLILITTVTTVILNTPQVTLILFGWSSDILQSISFIFFLFSGLVQPLLFLYRVGKPNFIKGEKTQTGV